MRNGTQEELDAAREDATKLPWDVLFRVSKTGEYNGYEFAGVTAGVIVHRQEGIDRPDSVGFIYVGSDLSPAHCSASDLDVIND